MGERSSSRAIRLSTISMTRSAGLQRWDHWRRVSMCITTSTISTGPLARHTCTTVCRPLWAGTVLSLWDTLMRLAGGYFGTPGGLIGEWEDTGTLGISNLPSDLDSLSVSLFTATASLTSPSYNTAAIDVWQKFGTANFALDAWSKRKHQNGNLYQTREGATHRDFKLLRSDTTGIGGLQVLTRTGEAPFNWTAGWWNLLDGTVPYGQPVLTGSSYGDNLEAVFVNTFGGLSRWRFSQKQQDWFAQGYDVGWWDGQQHYAPFYFQQSLKGYPGLTQLDDSSFALVVRTEDGGLNEVSRFYFSIGSETSDDSTS